MKFSNLFDDLYSPEELINEGKNFNDEKFDRFKDNAGWWLIDMFQNTPSDITKMPGFPEYRNFVLNNSKYSKDELKSFDDLVYSLPDYYGVWLNLLPFGQSNKIMSRTIAMYDLQDKMSGRDSSEPRKRGRKPKVKPEVGDDSDSMAHFDQAVEKRRRGRPSLPDDQKKKYIPTGRKAPGGARVGAGRPRKVSDEPTSYDDIIKTLRQRGRPRKVSTEPTPEFTLEPTNEPVVKQRGGARTGAGRPSKDSKYEPEMAQTRIKTLEDRIASLEALLREKGMLEEQRMILKSKLQMMKDYRKFL